MHLLALNYIFFSLYLLILLHKKGFNLRYELGDRIFIVISFIVLAILHVFVDVNSVEDLPGYQVGFKEMSYTSFENIFYVFRKGDPLYAILNKVIVTFTDDFYFFLLLYNILLLCSHYYVFKNYSPSPAVSVVIFLALFYNQSLFVLRQYIAISLLLLSIPFIFSKKILPYLIICAAAFFIHSSALLFVPLFFIYNIKNRKFFLLCLGAIAFMGSLLTTNIGYSLLAFVGYEEYINFDASYNLTVKLIPFVSLLLYIITLREKVLDDGINKLCLIGLFLYTVGYAFAPSVGLLSRILKYYEIFNLFAVPITMQYMRSRLLRFFYLFSFISLNGYLAIRNLSEFYFVDYRLKFTNVIYLFIILILGGVISKKYKSIKDSNKKMVHVNI